VPLLTIDEARRRFLAALPPAAPDTEEVDLAAALGRVTAEAVASAADVPPFDRSTVDGWAVRSADARPGARLRLAGEVRMGRPAGVSVAPGTCVAIPTGGMMPAGADAVLMVEDSVEAEPGWIEARAGVAPGRNVVRRGDDVRAGGPLLPAGRRLRPADLGALAGVGRTRVRVFRRPRVGVLSSGDEVVPADRQPAPGQVRDMNAASLQAALARDGCEPLALGIVADAADAVRRELTSALRLCDAVLVSGGSSVGERDHIPAVLDELGRPGLLFHGVAVKPGKPTGAAVVGGKVAVSLPGHPVSALLMYELLVRDALRRLGGEADPPPRAGVAATLAEDVAAPGQRDFYCRVRLDAGRAVPVEGGSALLTTMVRADGLLRVPRGERRAAGERVWVEVLE
jgi:molybdopterin molybdotransferase